MTTQMTRQESIDMADPRPVAIPVDPRHIPQELKDRRQWVVWRYEIANGKWTKVPHMVGSSRLAKSNDPETWTTFDQALEMLRYSSYYDGIGFMTSADDPYTGVDLDNAVDPLTGRLKPWAQQIFAPLYTYMERSPGGSGLRMFLKGVKPGIRCKTPIEDGKAELYGTTQFLTVTGAVHPGAPLTIEERQAELTELYNRLFPPRLTDDRPANLTLSCVSMADEEIIAQAKAAINGAKFSRLWDGNLADHGGNHSSADLALCCALAFWTGNDAGRIDQLFRQSGLYRAKWERADYRKWTIDKAIEGTPHFFGDGSGSRPGSYPSATAAEAASYQLVAGKWEFALEDSDPDEAASSSIAGPSEAPDGLTRSERQLRNWIDACRIAASQGLCTFDDENLTMTITKNGDVFHWDNDRGCPVCRLPEPTIADLVAKQAARMTCPNPYKRKVTLWKGGKMMIVYASCNRFDCECCGPAKRQQYKDTVDYHLASVSVVWAFVCDKTNWGTMQRWMNREKAQHFKLTIGNEFHVYASLKPTSNAGWGLRELHPDAAKHEINRLIDGFPANKHHAKAFTSSRGWKLVGDEKHVPKGWNRLAVSHCHDDAIPSIVEDNDLKLGDTFHDYGAYTTSKMQHVHSGIDEPGGEDAGGVRTSRNGRCERPAVPTDQFLRDFRAGRSHKAHVTMVKENELWSN